MTGPSKPERLCPQCGGGVVRIRRLREDRDASMAAPVRRFRCAAPACGWEGLLQVQRVRAEPRRRVRKSTTRAAATVFAALGFAFAATAAVKIYQRFLPNPALAQLAAHPVVPFGTSHDGTPIAPDHPLLLKVSAPAQPDPSPPPAPAEHSVTANSPRPLELRQDCAWGNPGRNPYKGTIEQALNGARLPPEIVAKMSAQIRAGKVTDRLEITNTGIRGVHAPREFSARSIAMTFGNTLCMNTRVNFVPGHMERADLYEVADAEGQTYSVMVPYVCGNVSVLSARAERDERPLATTIDNKTVTGSSGGGTTAEGQVPEPGTLLNIGAGAALMAWFLRRRRKAPARFAQIAADAQNCGSSKEQAP